MNSIAIINDTKLPDRGTNPEKNVLIRTPELSTRKINFPDCSPSINMCFESYDIAFNNIVS